MNKLAGRSSPTTSALIIHPKATKAMMGMVKMNLPTLEAAARES